MQGRLEANRHLGKSFSHDAMIDRNAMPLLKRFSLRGFFELCIEQALSAAAAFSVLITLCVIVILLYQSLQFFEVVSLKQFFLDTQWTPLFENQHFGIWPLVCGTLMTTGIALSIAVPFGLLAAIYLSEFASMRQRRWLKPTLELLSGIPTVVYGYFALVVLTPFLQRFIPNLSSFNALSAGLIMGIMIIPIVSSLSEDALSSVPRAVREAAFGLGCRHITSIARIIIPSAASGIMAAIMLALSRAIGETMIVAVAAGQDPHLTFDPRNAVETMTTYIVQISMGDTPQGTLEYKTIFAVGLSLFVFTFLTNLITQRFSKHLRRGAT